MCSLNHRPGKEGVLLSPCHSCAPCPYLPPMLPQPWLDFHVPPNLLGTVRDPLPSSRNERFGGTLHFSYHTCPRAPGGHADLNTEPDAATYKVDILASPRAPLLLLCSGLWDMPAPPEDGCGCEPPGGVGNPGGGPGVRLAGCPFLPLGPYNSQPI